MYTTISGGPPETAGCVGVSEFVDDLLKVRGYENFYMPSFTSPDEAIAYIKRAGFYGDVVRHELHARSKAAMRPHPSGEGFYFEQDTSKPEYEQCTRPGLIAWAGVVALVNAPKPPEGQTPTVHIQLGNLSPDLKFHYRGE
jgi:hypothetical protein